MCGRINVIDDPLCQWIGEQLGLDFNTRSNNDLCPSQPISAIASEQGVLMQLDTSWGIQPAWANRLLINAKAETVAEKRTFASAFVSNRRLVPCSGWYEWRTESGGKRKYLFEHASCRPLLMAAIGFSAPDGSAQLVTLTTPASPQCAAYHHRMPVLIAPEEVDFWFHADPVLLTPLMQYSHEALKISPC